MTTDVIRMSKSGKSLFKDKVMDLLPDGGNLNLCLTCGACSSGCPATGLEEWILGNFCAWPLWEWMKKF